MTIKEEIYKCNLTPGQVIEGKNKYKVVDVCENCSCINVFIVDEEITYSMGDNGSSPKIEDVVKFIQNNVAKKEKLYSYTTLLGNQDEKKNIFLKYINNTFSNGQIDDIKKIFGCNLNFIEEFYTEKIG